LRALIGGQKGKYCDWCLKEGTPSGKSKPEQRWIKDVFYLPETLKTLSEAI